jgi:hypothetical protein
MSENPVPILMEARMSALDNAAYVQVAIGDVDANEVLALAEKFTDWIMTGETPNAKFARVEAERFFRDKLMGAAHPSQRGPRDVFQILDEMAGEYEKGDDEHPEAP